jgi:truncated hemoglobin YjbI
MSARAKITTSYGGGVDVVLPDDVRDLLSSLARQLAELIDDPEAARDPGLQRLFPAASMDDPMEALGFEQLMGDALRQGKREAAAVLRATANATHLNGEETLAWMRCINDIRLVVGTRLDIQEDTDIEALFSDELMEQAAVTYVALTELVEMLARAADPT